MSMRRTDEPHSPPRESEPANGPGRSLRRHILEALAKALCLPLLALAWVVWAAAPFPTSPAQPSETLGPAVEMFARSIENQLSGGLRSLEHLAATFPESPGFDVPPVEPQSVEPQSVKPQPAEARQPATPAPEVGSDGGAAGLGRWLRLSLSFHPEWTRLGVGQFEDDGSLTSVDVAQGNGEQRSAAVDSGIRQVLTTGQPFISSAVDETGQLAVVLSAPVPAASGASHRVLYAQFAIAECLRRALVLPDEHSAALLLVDGDGRVLFSHMADGAMGAGWDVESRDELVRRGPQETATGGSRGGSTLGERRVEPMGWRLVWVDGRSMGGHQGRWTILAASALLLTLAVGWRSAIGLERALRQGMSVWREDLESSAWLPASLTEDSTTHGVARETRPDDTRATTTAAPNSPLGVESTHREMFSSEQTVTELADLEVKLQAWIARWSERYRQERNKSQTLERQLQKLRRAYEDSERRRQETVAAMTGRQRGRDSQRLPLTQLVANFAQLQDSLLALDRSMRGRETDGASAEGDDDALRGLERSVGEMRKRIETVADFSLAEEGGLVFQWEAFDPVAEAFDEVEAMRSQAEDKGLEWVWQGEEEPGPSMTSDRRRFRQVVRQILANAVQFTRRGRVKVTCGWQHDDQHGDPGGGVPNREETTAIPSPLFICRIEDSGVGIAYEAQQRLFSPPGWRHGHGIHEESGLGFGLPLCHFLVRSMGGNLSVESSPGMGSAFTLRWPTEPPQEAVMGLAGEPEVLSPEGANGADGHTKPSPGAEPGDDAATADGGHVLVVEDHEINREVMVSQLENLGFRVRAVVDGLDALEALREDAFDLILLDCQMPRLDGYETVRRIRASQEVYRSIPVIAVTAHAGDERQRCLAAGMDDYLVKPVRQSVLAAMLDRWMPTEPEDPTPSAGDVGAEPMTLDTGPMDGEAMLWGRDPGLDWETLEQIRSLGEASGKDLLGKVLRTLLRSLPERLATCRKLLRDDDRQAVGELAHGLKGSAGNGGAVALAAALGQLEEAARDDGDLHGALDAVEAEQARVLPVLRRLLEVRMPAPAED